ncbi:endothelin-converting enzyme 1-like [Saccostrea echinata]|uniref:endothelin-converting enzyme 1-like n=1 Tax=Saccostrea echinata TaxID=191078 RepID=UPI002A7F99E5|nr:endothelin-converting enzyme 1-like [Saccostrea echinata]
MTENYAEFGKSTDRSPIVPEVTIRSYSFRVTEIALGLVAFLAVVVCIVLGTMVSSGAGNGTNSPSTSAQTGGQNQLCVSPPCLKSASYVVSNLNTSVQPCDNFYRYACGRFKTEHPLDSETSSITVYSNMYYHNEEKLKKILESPIVRSQDYSTERKLKHYFSSCTDTYRKERAKGTPLITKVINNIGGWYVLGTFSNTSFDFHTAFRKVSVDYWTAAFYTFRVATDWYDWHKRVIELDYSGMSMFWYYYTEPSTEKYRNDMKTFMRRLANFLVRDSNITLDNATKNTRIETFINDAFTIEMNLANITKNTMPTSDPHAYEKRVSISDLNTMLGTAIDFSTHIMYMFNDANVGPSTKIVLREADWLKKMNDMIDGLGVNKTRMLNNYLVWKLMDRYDVELSWEYVHASREFFVDRYGIPQFLGTWLYCFQNMDRYLGDALSSMYVRDHFADANKQKAHEILDYVKEALIDSTMNNVFMDDATKAKAKDKMKGSLDKLGYPDFMMNDAAMDNLYSSLQVDQFDYFGNLLSVNKFIQKSWNKKLKNHVNKQEEWVYRTYDTFMSYYNPWNELLVPAGLLQFPFYDYTLPHFMNFGSMGSVIAHHLVHGIDHSGGYYNVEGVFEDWWSNQTTNKWIEAKRCVENYYNNQTMGPFTIPGQTIPLTVKVNGVRWAAEAMAETSGVQIAYKAYKKWVQKNGGEKMAPGLGLTNDQMFFVSYAQASCYNRNDNVAYYNAVRGTVSEDIRTNSALSQIKEFSTAFNCPAKTPMNAEVKCSMYG